MDQEKAYEELIKQHAVGEEVSIPSIIDALPLLEIYRNIDLDAIIAGQFEGMMSALNDNKLKALGPKRTVSFFIPLTSFIPLPETYNAAIMDRVNRSKKRVDRFTCVTVKHYYPKLGHSCEVLLKLSYVIVTIGDTSYGAINTKPERNKNINEIYHDAIKAVNKVIDSYKATPMRHNHLLQPITPLGTPGHVYTLIGNTEHGHILNRGVVILHEHLVGELFASRKMDDDEINIFQQIHIRNSLDDALPLRMIKKLNEAIDARCMGRNESAVILADNYTEQAMRYWLYRILIEKGATELEARKRSRGFEKVTMLKNELAKELNYSQSEFDKKIRYARWYQLCRNKRNGLAHDFLYEGDSHQLSYDAVQESASIIKSIAEIAVEKYTNLYQDGRIFWASTWMLDRIKHSS